MSMVVQHNMSAMNATRNLGSVSGALSKSTEKLSSGYRINRAGDDAAGLAISEKMRGQVRGLNRASTNAQDGISLIQTAEGALTETHSILQRMRELAVQAASDTNTDDDRTQIQNEIEQLTNEVDRIASTTEFNTMKLLDGSRSGAVSAKDGSAYVEGTFTNSMVTAEITTDNSADADYTEIARIEITKDFTAGMSTVAKDKYSLTDLNNAYTFITSAAGYSSTADWADNVKNAVDKLTDNGTADKLDLAGLKETVKSYETAIATNESKLTSALAGIDALKFTESDGTQAVTPTKDVDVYAAGVTKDDVAKAVDNLINAYVKSGQTANESSEEIINAKAELEALFNSDTTKVVESYAQTSYGTYDVDANVNTASGMLTLGSAPTGRGSADAASSGTAIQTTATTALTDTIDAVTDEIATALETVAKQMASAHLGKAAAEANVTKMEEAIELVGNEELTKAYKAYDIAKTELDGATTEPEIEIAQAKLDSATDALNKLNKTGEEVLSVTDLFGNTASVNKFEIAKSVADDGTLTINLKNGAGKDDTVITISNANQLKAGDVITITSNAKVESHAANSGEEALRLQIGANAGQEMNMSINSMRARDLGIVQTKEGNEGKALDVTSQASASLAVNAFDLAIQKVSTERAKMGAVQNRLEHTISNLDTSAENLQAAESRIRDTDMAEEMTNYSKNNILQQAGQSMLAQANQSTQGVLSLLQ